MRFLTFTVLLLFTTAAEAHEPSRSYLDLHADGDRIKARLDMPLAELHHAIGLDVDGDGRITWGEIEVSQTQIRDLAAAGARISTLEGSCIAQQADLSLSDHDSGPFGVLQWSVDCPKPSRVLLVDWALFQDQNPQHQGIIKFTNSADTIVQVANSGDGAIRLGPQDETTIDNFILFIEQGVIHIFEGIDHWLFLVTLLLPTVLWRRDAEGWRPAEAAGNVFLTVAKIVTAFTIAHSITLALAAMDIVSLPPRWIEAAIAATVILAALNNIWPLMTTRVWLMAFGFGLIHGFGFANVLWEIELPAHQFVIGLLGFNLGVEAGQLFLVALVLPVLLMIRRSAFYAQMAMPAASAAIALIGLLWLVERTL